MAETTTIVGNLTDDPELRFTLNGPVGNSNSAGRSPPAAAAWKR